MRFLLILTILYAFTARADDSKQFIRAIDQRNWAVAAKTSDKDLRSLALWLKLTTEKKADFNEIISFIKQHPHWPKQDSLLQKAEESADSNHDAQQWFKTTPPQTNNGKLKYLSAITEASLKKQHAREIWHTTPLNKLEEEAFIKKYQVLLSEADHLKRIDYLLYNHQIDAASKLLPYLSPTKRKAYAFRIDVKKGKTAIEIVDSKTDIGILHDLAHKLEADDDQDTLVSMLELASGMQTPMQVYFWKLKVKLIRKLIQEHEYKNAYLFASSHGTIDSKEYSEAEWLAGWISLRFMNDPKSAIVHFTNVYNKVKMPMSLSRGAYWLARSYESLNNHEKSTYWYKISAKYYTSFYGQVAICKINKCQLNLSIEEKTTNAEIQKYRSNPLVKAGLILEQTKYSYLSKLFFLKAIDNSQDAKEITYITKLKFNLDHHFTTELAKRAGYKNIIILDASYPNPNFIYSKAGVDKALVLSLIRQESVFNHEAISTAGAMGLMQIMPHVAKETAKKAKIKYNQAKLIKDQLFNTRLGVSHLEELLDKYDNSYILAIAAYNAGSKSANKWIDDNGDPRKMKTTEEIIDWLEMITFHETRNYVQRVLENHTIYHAMLNKHNKINLRLTQGK